MWVAWPFLVFTSWCLVHCFLVLDHLSTHLTNYFAYLARTFFRFDSTSSVNEGLKIMCDRCSWLRDKNVSNFALFVCRRIEWVSSILICQFYEEKRYKYIIKQNLPKNYAFLAVLCAKRFYKVTNILKIFSSTDV